MRMFRHKLGQGMLLGASLVFLCGCTRVDEFSLKSYKDPTVRVQDVSAGDILTINGQVRAQEHVEACEYAAILMLHYYDASGLYHNPDNESCLRQENEACC